jgi:hypothetical protein
VQELPKIWIFAEGDVAPVVVVHCQDGGLVALLQSRVFHIRILKGLSHQIFKAFFTYDIKSVLSVWTLMVLHFFCIQGFYEYLKMKF